MRPTPQTSVGNFSSDKPAGSTQEILETEYSLTRLNDKNRLPKILPDGRTDWREGVRTPLPHANVRADESNLRVQLRTLQTRVLQSGSSRNGSVVYGDRPVPIIDNKPEGHYKTHSPIGWPLRLLAQARGLYLWKYRWIRDANSGDASLSQLAQTAQRLNEQ